MFGSIRLARFNTELQGFDKEYFSGLPIPIAAITLSSFVIFIDAMTKSNHILVSFLSILAVYTQFLGYGLGYAKSIFRLFVRRMDVREAFPAMFS